MNTNSEIMKIKAKIQASFSYLMTNDKFLEITSILEQKYNSICENYKDVTDEFEIKKFLAILNHFFDSDIRIVLEMFDNNKVNQYESIYDDSDKAISDELEAKINEILKWIDETKKQYDDSLVDYIEGKYEKIINNYKKELDEVNSYKMKQFINYLKHDINLSLDKKELEFDYIKFDKKDDINLTLYNSFDTIKNKCLNELSLVLDDFIIYLKTLSDRKIIIDNKEKSIIEKIKNVKEDLNYDLTSKLNEIKNEYLNKLNNTRTIDMQIGKLQSEFENKLDDLSIHLDKIIKFTEINKKVKSNENIIEELIKYIIKFIDFSLKDKYYELKKNYDEKVKNIENFNDNYFYYQAAYLDETKILIENYSKIKDECKLIEKSNNYLDYLNNTNVLLINFKKLDEISLFTKDYNNKVLKEKLYDVYYQLLIYDLRYNDGNMNLYDKFNDELKTFIETNFLNELSRYNNKEFYQEILYKYFNNGFNLDLLKEYSNCILEIDLIELSKTINENIEVVDYQVLGNEEYFDNDEIGICVNRDSKEYFRVKKDGKVEKLPVPSNAYNVTCSDEVITYLVQEDIGKSKIEYDNRYFVYSGYKYYAITLNGKVIFQDEIPYVSVAYSGAITNNINSCGNVPIRKLEPLDYYKNRCRDGIIKVESPLFIKFIDKYGKEIIRSLSNKNSYMFTENRKGNFSNYYCGLLKCIIYSRTLFYDKQGNNAQGLYNLPYDCEVSDFSCGYAVVKEKKKRFGKVIVECYFVDTYFLKQFSDFKPIENFSQGYALVFDIKNKCNCYIDVMGNVVSEKVVLEKRKENRVSEYILYHNKLDDSYMFNYSNGSLINMLLINNKNKIYKR